MCERRIARRKLLFRERNLAQDMTRNALAFSHLLREGITGTG